MKPPLYFLPPLVLQSTVWRIIMRPFFYLFLRIQVQGLDRLRDISGPVIFAPNHPTEIDATLLPIALPFWSHFSPMFYVAREPAYYQDPYFAWRRVLYAGWIFKLLGAFPVRSGVRDYSVSLANHVRIFQDGGSVCIFPEGVLSRNGAIGAAHGGVGYLVLATGATVVPVYFGGIANLSLSDFFLRRRRSAIMFGTPILAHELLTRGMSAQSTDDCRAVAKLIMDKVRGLESIYAAQTVGTSAPAYLYKQ